MRTILLFPGALGDLVLLAPAVTALAQTSRVDLSVQRAVRTVAAGLVPVTLGPPVDGVAMSSLFGTGPLEASLSAWLDGADVVHTWFGRHREDVAAGLARATIGRIVSHSVHRNDGVDHVGLAYAADLGMRGPIAAPHLRLPPPQTAPIWNMAPAARLVIHPGAGASAKRWPVDRFRALADAWRGRGGEVTVLCGPAEEDLIAGWRTTSHRVVADVELAVVASLIASAPLYVGNDSGISHLAGALARAGVVLFGPTRSARWRPRGGRLDALPFHTTCAEIVSLLGEVTARGCLDTPPNRH